MIFLLVYSRHSIERNAIHPVKNVSSNNRQKYRANQFFSSAHQLHKLYNACHMQYYENGAASFSRWLAYFCSYVSSTLFPSCPSPNKQNLCLNNTDDLPRWTIRRSIFSRQCHSLSLSFFHVVDLIGWIKIRSSRDQRDFAVLRVAFKLPRIVVLLIVV